MVVHAKRTNLTEDLFLSLFFIDNTRYFIEEVVKLCFILEFFDLFFLKC